MKDKSEEAGYRRYSRSRLTRKYKKTIRFNAKELSVIDQFCTKYNIKSQAGFFRDTIIDSILRQMDDGHPRLF